MDEETKKKIKRVIEQLDHLRATCPGANACNIRSQVDAAQDAYLNAMRVVSMELLGQEPVLEW